MNSTSVLIHILLIFTCTFICLVLLALDACHTVGILHRNITPENVMITEKGYIKVAGFSSARIMTNMSECTVRHSTNMNTAPEVYLAPHVPHGPASDRFSMGVVLCEMLSGRHPFPSQIFKDLLSAASPSKAENSARHINKLKPVDLSFLWSIPETEVSTCCKQFVGGMLQLNPPLRIGTKDGMKGIWRHKWLINFDWIGLETQTTTSPLYLDIIKNVTNNFSAASTCTVNDQIVPRYISPTDQNKFIEFGLNDRNYDEKLDNILRSTEDTLLRSQCVPNLTTDGLKWTHTCTIKSAFKELSLAASDTLCVGSPSSQRPLSVSQSHLDNQRGSSLTIDTYGKIMRFIQA